jgi:hypothetical protein
MLSSNNFKRGDFMKKNVLLIGMFSIIMLLGITSSVSAQYQPTVDLGDVRIYKVGWGTWIIESDRIGMTLPLKFTQSNGWIEVVCASESQEFLSGQLGSMVEKIVQKAVKAWVRGSSLVGMDQVAGHIAGSVAEWAAKQTIADLCN